MRRDREAGAAATEFALIAPILIVLFFGIVQVGLAVYRYHVVEASAREGARIAAVGGTEAEATAIVQAAATAFAPAELIITVEECDNTLAPGGDTTTVSVQATGARFDYTIPFVGSFSPNFASTATFRCEQDA